MREPEAARFFVHAQLVSGSNFRSAEHRDAQFFFVDRVPFRRGHQFPSVRDGFLLEIIAKGKIAQHLKKGVMPLRKSNIFQVVVLPASAHTFLRAGGAGVLALFQPQKNILELVHPGVGEEQRRIPVRHQRTTSHPAMALTVCTLLAFEELQKLFPNLVAGHGFHSRKDIIAEER